MEVTESDSGIGIFLDQDVYPLVVDIAYIQGYMHTDTCKRALSSLQLDGVRTKHTHMLWVCDAMTEEWGIRVECC